jgi:hypothetical protein
MVGLHGRDDDEWFDDFEEHLYIVHLNVQDARLVRLQGRQWREDLLFLYLFFLYLVITHDYACPGTHRHNNVFIAYIHVVMRVPRLVRRLSRRRRSARPHQDEDADSHTHRCEFDVHA